MSGRDGRTENDEINGTRAVPLTLAAALLADACAGGRTLPGGPASTFGLVEQAPPPAAATHAPSAVAAASPITLDTVVAADEITLSVTSPVTRGETAIATAKTVPRADCTIVVTYSSGIAAARGLEGKAADGAGDVSWSWTVGADTISGSWPVEVSCSTPSGLRAIARRLFTVR